MIGQNLVDVYRSDTEKMQELLDRVKRRQQQKKLERQRVMEVIALRAEMVSESVVICSKPYHVHNIVSWRDVCEAGGSVDRP